MVLRELVQFELGHKISMDSQNNAVYYYFDYDERNSVNNMVFQHVHPFYEIIVFLDDTGEVQIEGKTFAVQFGDIVLMKPSALHKSIYREGATSKRLIINFNFDVDHLLFEDSIRTILTTFHAPTPIYRFETYLSHQIYELLNGIYAISKTPGFKADEPTDQLLLHMQFIKFLLVLFKERNHSIYTNTHFKHHSVQKIQEICSFIHTHYSTDISLNTISKSFFLSPSYLSRQFKDVTGFNITDYIQQTRIKNAQAQLLMTEHSISDISQNCGFTSFSQFNRVFKKITDLTPSEYKKIGVRRR